MWNTRIVWRVFQVPLKFFVTNYYIFIVCVQSFVFAVQSDSVRRPIGFRSPSNRIPSAIQLDSVCRLIGFRPLSGGKCTKKTEQAWASTCSVCIVSLSKLSINRRFPDSS
jgi:hypothetical protein